ncbi:MAG: 2,3-diaminopropionate biosynthesis protein SbnA [Candidatus Paceibacterota bacterium]
MLNYALKDDAEADNTGNTPIIQIKLKGLDLVNLYIKLEGENPTGSIKDRAASFILRKIVSNREINKNTIILESSSGNFGISLSEFCKKIGLKFYCVIDKNISPENEEIIHKSAGKVFKISEADENGGYLLNRIRKIKELQKKIPNSYWVNQYANPYNAAAYYETLGNEICSSFRNIDYVFIGVSSGGTITGVSQKIKLLQPKAKVIAVDISGSVIFGGVAKKRYIPGIGSSMVPSIIEKAKIDDVVTVSEKDTVNACRDFLKTYNHLIGGSSGSVIAAIYKYFNGKQFERAQTVITVFPDRGERYISTIYNDEWCKKII